MTTYTNNERYSLSMPNYIRVNVKEINQHENILGKDENNSKYDAFTLETKHRSAIRLFDAVAGHGVRGA